MFQRANISSIMIDRKKGLPLGYSVNKIRKNKNNDLKLEILFLRVFSHRKSHTVIVVLVSAEGLLNYLCTGEKTSILTLKGAEH